MRKDTKFRKLLHFLNDPDSTGFLFLILVSSLLVLIIYYFNEAYPTRIRPFIRYVAFLPTLLVAYKTGIRYGLMVASFFAMIFIPDLYESVTSIWFSIDFSQLLTFLISLLITTFFVSELATSTRARLVLSSTVDDWKELLIHASNFEEVVHFVLDQSKMISKSQESILLLLNPLSAQWEMINRSGTKAINIRGLDQGRAFNLAEWIIYENRFRYFNHLNREYFLSHPVNKNEDQSFIKINSILFHPLRHQDGTRFGILVLINKDNDEFTEADFIALKDFISGSERALEQAGLYARTDYSLAKRVRQLGAIQRTARELKTTLDPEEISKQALNCAIEITGAEAGLIKIEMKGFPIITRTVGEVLDIDQQIKLLEEPTSNYTESGNVPGSPLPTLSPKVSSRILTPLKRELQSYGYLIVESQSPNIFKEDAKHVLGLLADHIAIALENVLLFNEIKMEQERVTTIINSLSDGVITVDKEGMIMSYNQASEKIMGISLDNEIGHWFGDLFEIVNSENDEHDILKALQSRMPILDLRAYVRANKTSKRILSLSLTPISETIGHPEGAVILFRDITDQEEMERVQQELITAISHELRAPLANISTIIETIISDTSNPAIQPYVRYLNHLLTQTKRLSDFADRMLDVYRLETGQIIINLQPEPIYLLIEKVIADWQVVNTHKIVFTTPPMKSPWVWVDAKAFESVLNNMIENAVKYSPHGTKIEIIVELRGDKYVTCGVKDQGPGIDYKFQGKIFNRFYRVDGGDSQKVYGYGLGLYICRNLVEAMGGQIWVESEVGKGSFFGFTVALMEEDHERENLNY